jgi:Tfp pilus assembly protein PilZ
VKCVTQSIERRTSRRFQLMLPVLFRLADRVERYAGYCGNIGLGGMFVLTEQRPSIGTQVEVEVVVPAFDLVPREHRFRCTGRVIRVEACLQLRGFAVSGRIEGEGMQDDIETLAVGLMTKQ